MDAISMFLEDIEYLTEVAYANNPLFKKIEDEFAAIIDEVKSFYDGMKKHRLNVNSINDIYRYYYSNMPNKDEVRFTSYDEHVKKIEDLIMQIFKFRSVNINFQLISIYGPNTRPMTKSIMTVPVMIYGRYSIEDLPDIGILNDGKTKYRVGYKSIIKASSKGIVDTSNSVTLNVNMQMYEKLEPKHYVAILLHEIGHNIDIESMNIEVKNDAKMLKVIQTQSHKSSVKDQPGTVSIFFKLLKDHVKTKETYASLLNKHIENIAKSIGYGGSNKRGELWADSLPVAFGYGPALLSALNVIMADTRGVDKFEQTKGLFSAIKNYKKAIAMASKLDRRETDVHGSNMYRMKVALDQLEKDLKTTTDSALKKRIESNIKEIQDLIKQIKENPDNSDELRTMIATWADNIKV